MKSTYRITTSTFVVVVVTEWNRRYKYKVQMASSRYYCIYQYSIPSKAGHMCGSNFSSLVKLDMPIQLALAKEMGTKMPYVTSRQKYLRAGA